VPIGASTVSTGAKGHATPTGVFTILQKRQEHYSSTYNNAPMPYMQRLTWDGIALHAGKLPGYPASKGCIRLPLQFSKLVFGVTKTGMTVVITNKAEVPKIVPTPDLAPATYFARADLQWHPEKATKGPVSIVISAADQKAYVIRNGIPIGSSPVKIDRSVNDTLAFEYRNDDKNGPQWIGLELHDNGKNTGVPRDEWQHIQAPPEFKKSIAQVIHAGAVIVVTPESLHQGSTGMRLTVIGTDKAKKKG
jgi:L,D-transpeptidase catalytic domain